MWVSRYLKYGVDRDSYRMRILLVNIFLLIVLELRRVNTNEL